MARKGRRGPQLVDVLMLWYVTQRPISRRCAIQFAHRSAPPRFALMELRIDPTADLAWQCRPNSAGPSSKSRTVRAHARRPFALWPCSSWAGCTGFSTARRSGCTSPASGTPSPGPCSRSRPPAPERPYARRRVAGGSLRVGKTFGCHQAVARPRVQLLVRAVLAAALFYGRPALDLPRAHARAVASHRFFMPSRSSGAARRPPR